MGSRVMLGLRRVVSDPRPIVGAWAGVRRHVPVRVALVDGVVVGVGVAVGADAGQVRIPPVRADEAAHMRPPR